MTHRKFGIFGLLMLAVSLMAGTYSAGAQSPLLNTLKPTLEEAASDGATVIVISPKEDDDAAPSSLSAAEQMQQNALSARAEARRLFPKIVDLPGEIDTFLRSQGQPGKLNWLYWSVAIAAGGILCGLGVTWLLFRRTRRFIDMVRVPNPVSRSDKFPFLFVRHIVFTVNTIVIFTVAALVAVILDYNHPPSQNTIFVIISAYCINYYLRWAMYNNFTVSDEPEYRMLFATDEDAHLAFRNWSIADALFIIVFAAVIWLFELGLTGDAMALTTILGVLVAVGIMIFIFTHERRRLGWMALGGQVADGKPLFRRLLARVWVGTFVAYLAFGAVATVFRILVGLHPTPGIILAPMIIFTMSLVSYITLVVIVDKIFERRLKVQQAEYDELVARETAEIEARAEARRQEEEANDDADFIPVEEVPQLPRPPQLSVFKPVAERAVFLAIVIGSILFLGDVWGIDFSNDGLPLTRALDVLVVLFIGYLAFIGVAAWIDSVIEAEEPSEEEGDSESMGEIGGAGASRLATLLPIFRNFLLITIVVTTGMIVLSGMGVDITPLFAGAGVVGLAIGFGAQTLIRDIFSGAFFLMDDAFRRGEYIDIGSAKGTVEKISIRSMQLRHHNGPLNTVPFGEITQLTNFSRDWVIMKLTLRLTYDTDANKVRKMIKKLGQELLGHPEIGHLFLNPLKSQGVLAMEDSAMIMRIKFMTKPGDQFLVRRYVLDAIRKLFAENDIKFANREVTVRLADDDEKAESAHKKALAGAAAAGLLQASADTVPGAAAKDMP